MDKRSSAKKKPNRKLRRVIRKTIAAILMVSAIAVAAIPAGKTRAGSVTTNTNTVIGDDGRTAPIAYAYNETSNNGGVYDDRRSKSIGDATKAAANGFSWADPDSSWSTGTMFTSVNDAKLAKYHNGTIEDDTTGGVVHELSKAYSTRLASNGNYYINWQFAFSDDTIYKYNDNFAQSTVTLPYQVPTWYLQVSTAQFDSFFGASDQTTAVTYSYDTWLSYDANYDTPQSDQGKFMMTYNSASYNQFITLCRQYRSDFTNYTSASISYSNNTATNKGTAPTAPTKPADISLKPCDMSNDLKYKYYCSNDAGIATFTSGPTSNTKAVSKFGNDLTLMYAYDESTGRADPVYLIKVNTDTVLANGASKDPNGFVTTESSSTPITSIGDYAFAGVNGIDTLELPSEIINIGDYAFKNSFIKSIKLTNVVKVGNGAFKDCTQLSMVDLGSNKLAKIGAEAFENTAITSFTPTYAVGYIGVGAFANCASLATVNMSNITAALDICDWAFYGDTALTSLKFPMKETAVDSIGKYVFAVPLNGKNAALSMTLPVNLALDPAKNDYMVSGRSNLTSLTFPETSTSFNIPKNMFYGCTNLSYVEFPDACRQATFRDNLITGITDPSNPRKTISVNTLFLDVTNPNFYVTGPGYVSGSTVATERNDTWYARTMVNDYVPYVYTYQGVKYYEISDGTYRLTADESGELVSCVPIDDTATTDIDITIPTKVGNYTITSIKAGCFSDDKIKERLHSVIIPDGTLTSIPDNSFEGLPNLTWVKIGNSVTKIGASAFESDSSLVDVTFDSLGKNYANLSLGTDAFTTGGSRLVVHGDIQPGYAPFDWAVNADNYVNKTTGVRVCYISLDPTDLMVMYDNDSKLVTLVDYPKWEELDIDHFDYDRSMETYYYGIYGSSASAYNEKRAAFYSAFKISPADAYASDNYGPWIDKTFCDNPYDTVTTSSTTAKAEKNRNTLLAWLYQPVVAQAADAPEPYFSKNLYNIVSNLENTDASPKAWETATTDEIAWGKACTDIAIPSGVQSVNAYKFYTSGGNAKDVSTYLNGCADIRNNGRPLVSSNEYKMYFTDKTAETVSGNDTTNMITTTPGLFSGHYDDSVSGENYIRGNDRINSVAMSSVTSLPDYAFDSCENLTSVTLGDKCTTVGTAPFRSDAKLAAVNGNSTIVSNNGIIYDTASVGDGTYKIVECLAGRGSVVGSSYVGDATDANETADLAKTSAIADGAFEDCDYIKNIDLSTTKVKTIPESCFKNCDSLTGKVILPTTAGSIKSEAFKNDKKVTVTIPSTEVFIATDAFEHGVNAKKDAGDAQVTFRTYPESAASEYAAYYDIECDTALGKIWNVSFMDYNGTQIGSTIQAASGTVLSSSQKPANPTRSGYTFSKWISTTGIAIDDKITSDTTFFASYTAESGTHDGNYYVYFYDGVDGSLISKVTVASGAAATAPAALTHSGYTFSKWSGDFSKVTADMSVIALYASSSSSPTASSSAAAAQGTSTSKTSTSSSSGSSSTNSSTSTSTSTSAGSFLVTVVNGSGSGTYASGTTVAVVAAAAPSGKVFSKWTVEPATVALVNAGISATTFTMPASAVTVTANFVDAASAASSSAKATAKSSGSSTSASANSTGASSTNGGNNAQVVIDNVPEIPNQDVATALVHGSSDQYVVKITKTDAATKAVESALKNRYGSLDNLVYDAMDITLYDSTGTKQITNTTNISVDITIPIPDTLKTYGGNNMAGAVANNTLESLSPKFTTINSVPCVTFTATHFSPYTVYVDKTNLDASEMLDATPKTGDPLNPKWFLAIGMACMSVILFLKRDSLPVAELAGIGNVNVNASGSVKPDSAYDRYIRESHSNRESSIHKSRTVSGRSSTGSNSGNRTRGK